MSERKEKEERKSKGKSEHIIGMTKQYKEPVDYGITKGQFYEILDKAAQPVKKDTNLGK